MADEVEVRPADATLEELKETQDGTARADKNLLRTPGVALGIDIPNNRVEYKVTGRDNPGKEKLDEALRVANVKRPDKVETELLTAPPRDELYGGFRVWNVESKGDCTTGFSVVENGIGREGQVTAAHCDNALYRTNDTYKQYPLRLQAPEDGRKTAYHDIQFMDTPSHYDDPYIKDGNYSDTVSPGIRPIF